MKRLGLLPVTALGFVIACQSDRPVRPPASPSADISDGAHAANCLTAVNTCVLSNAHFFFLPPMVPAPTTSGVFNPALAPTVMICQLGSDDKCATAPFSPGVVQLDLSAPQYRVNWNTDPLTIIVGNIYRVIVSAGGQELGFADVQPVTNGSLKNVETGEFIGLVDGRTLPIKFRIEQGAICFAQTNCVEQTVGAAGGDVTTPPVNGIINAAAHFPQGYFTQPTTVAIAKVAEGCFAQSSPHVPWSVFGCYSFTTDPKATDALNCTADPTNATKCARVEVCPTISASDPRYFHLELFKSDPGQPLKALPEVLASLITNCPGLETQPSGIGLSGHPIGDLARAGWRSVTEAVRWLVGPQPVFGATAVVHDGIGGLTCCFSNIGVTLPLTMSTVSGTSGNSAPVGTQVAPDPAVLLQYMHPSPPTPAVGFPVNFAVVFGGGAVSASSATTDAGGMASVHWTLGPALGTNQLVATMESASGSPDTLTATGTRRPTVTSLFTGASLAEVGTPLTLTATVTPAPPAAESPMVEFFDGTTSLGSSSVGAGGVATLTTSSLSLAEHSLSANFGGTTTFIGSASGTLAQHMIQRFNSLATFTAALGGVSAETQTFEGMTVGTTVATIVSNVLNVSSPFDNLQVFSCTTPAGADACLFGFDNNGNPTRTAGNGQYTLQFVAARNALAFDVEAENPAAGPAHVLVQTAGGAITFAVSNTTGAEINPVFLGMIASQPLQSVNVHEGTEVTGTGSEEIALDDFVLALVTLAP